MKPNDSVLAIHGLTLRFAQERRHTDKYRELVRSYIC
jgi:hypothetical protein